MKDYTFTDKCIQKSRTNTIKEGFILSFWVNRACEYVVKYTIGMFNRLVSVWNLRCLDVENVIKECNIIVVTSE